MKKTFLCGRYLCLLWIGVTRKKSGMQLSWLRQTTCRRNIVTLSQCSLKYIACPFYICRVLCCWLTQVDMDVPDHSKFQFTKHTAPVFTVSVHPASNMVVSGGSAFCWEIFEPVGWSFRFVTTEFLTSSMVTIYYADMYTCSLVVPYQRNSSRTCTVGCLGAYHDHDMWCVQARMTVHTYGMQPTVLGLQPCWQNMTTALSLQVTACPCFVLMCQQRGCWCTYACTRTPILTWALDSYWHVLDAEKCWQRIIEVSANPLTDIVAIVEAVSAHQEVTRACRTTFANERKFKQHSSYE